MATEDVEKQGNLPQRERSKTMRTITLEEHFATPAFLEGLGRQLKDFPQAAQMYRSRKARICSNSCAT
ncbi:MAG TPA: hypothetical protein VEB88_06070 [Candidatus Acidoferrales bacterium]|nr:hypothetical protein [Candidatus Acidoferrales bacterium]